jgi:hypothetical protein
MLPAPFLSTGTTDVMGRPFPLCFFHRQAIDHFLLQRTPAIELQKFLAPTVFSTFLPSNPVRTTGNFPGSWGHRRDQIQIRISCVPFSRRRVRLTAWRLKPARSTNAFNPCSVLARHAWTTPSPLHERARSKRATASDARPPPQNHQVFWEGTPQRASFSISPAHARARWLRCSQPGTRLLCCTSLVAPPSPTHAAPALPWFGFATYGTPEFLFNSCSWRSGQGPTEDRVLGAHGDHRTGRGCNAVQKLVRQLLRLGLGDQH